LSDLTSLEAMDLLQDKLDGTKNNREFLQVLNS
jgi:transcription termination factor Rho